MNTEIATIPLEGEFISKNLVEFGRLFRIDENLEVRVTGMRVETDEVEMRRVYNRIDLAKVCLEIKNEAQHGDYLINLMQVTKKNRANAKKLSSLLLRIVELPEHVLSDPPRSINKLNAEANKHHELTNPRKPREPKPDADPIEGFSILDDFPISDDDEVKFRKELSRYTKTIADKTAEKIAALEAELADANAKLSAANAKIEEQSKLIAIASANIAELSAAASKTPAKQRSAKVDTEAAPAPLTPAQKRAATRAKNKIEEDKLKKKAGRNLRNIKKPDSLFPDGKPLWTPAGETK